MTEKGKHTPMRLTVSLTSPDTGEAPWFSMQLGLGLVAGAIHEALRKGNRRGKVISPSGRYMGDWELRELEGSQPERSKKRIDSPA